MQNKIDKSKAPLELLFWYGRQLWVSFGNIVMKNKTKLVKKYDKIGILEVYWKVYTMILSWAISLDSWKWIECSQVTKDDLNVSTLP